jgi:hypothetical protein
MSPNVTTSPLVLGRHLHEFLYSPDIFALLDPHGCGWLDGGCRILADAVGLWLAIDYRAALVDVAGHAQHSFIMIDDWHIDGDGISRPDTFLRRWRDLEGVDGHVVKDGIALIVASHMRNSWSMPQDMILSRHLAGLIDTKLPATMVLSALRRPRIATLKNNRP